MKILVLNGPNLNMLGIREPEVYGSDTYDDLVKMIKSYCNENNIEVNILQSNCEGKLVSMIQQAYFDKVDGIVFNPAAYTHTSIALLDALKSVNIPCIEVHISDVSVREDFRQVSYIRSACFKSIMGEGFNGYISAIKALVDYLK